MSMERKYINSKKQTAYAWARYYQECEESLASDTRAYHGIVNATESDGVADEVIPQFVIDELKGLLDELKKKIECPICFDVIEANDLGITNCGHKYCKTCLDRLKTTTKKCAICRKTIAK